MTNQAVDHERFIEKLEQLGQSHLLRFWDEISDQQRKQLIDQVDRIDFQQLQTLVDGNDTSHDWNDLASRAELPPAITLDEFKHGKDAERAEELGAEAIAAGQVAMILVAGGQGSRLGFEHPKGMFPIGPISERSLYQMILEKVKARAQQFSSTIPVYVMTSPPTHAESEKFLQENNFFELGSEDVHLFCQGVMPAIDDNGKLLLSDKHSVFVSPDGHGGTLAALHASGCLADMQQRGIKYVFYGQVDNPLIQVCDPALIGYHVLHQSEMTSQVVRKNDPLQKVGNVVSIDGQVQIIEYSDLPEQFARQTNDSGELKLWAGSIAVHVFDLDFLVAANEQADSLPFHRARKQVPFVDDHGQVIQPENPNATKFEKFIFDLLPNSKNAIVCEVDPAEGFCAVKNAAPAKSETPEHVRAAISALHTNWLNQCGVEVDNDVQVEINPLFAVDVQQLAGKVSDLDRISKDTYFV